MGKRTGGMRVIAGRFRRRVVEAKPGESTRPITDRVKEALFARLCDFRGELLPETEGGPLRALDVFAGTGTIGLEALSRGATHAVFIERDPEAAEILARNLDAFGLTDEETVVWQTDVTRCGFLPKRPDNAALVAERFVPYDLVTFDPPYPLAADLRPGTPLFRSLKTLAKPTVTTAKARLVLRVPTKTDLVIPDEWRDELWEFEMSNMRLICRGKPLEGESTEEEE